MQALSRIVPPSTTQVEASGCVERAQGCGFGAWVSVVIGKIPPASQVQIGIRQAGVGEAVGGVLIDCLFEELDAAAGEEDAQEA